MIRPQSTAGPDCRSRCVQRLNGAMCSTSMLCLQSVGLCPLELKLTENRSTEKKKREKNARTLVGLPALQARSREWECYRGGGRPRARFVPPPQDTTATLQTNPPHAPAAPQLLPWTPPDRLVTPPPSAAVSATMALAPAARTRAFLDSISPRFLVFWGGRAVPREWHGACGNRSHRRPP